MDEEVDRLSRELENRWNELEVEELAEKIIQLEARVALMKGAAPRVAKLKRQVEHYHFRFVFPIVLEIDATPRSFAKTIQQMANQIFKSGSVAVFNSLNDIQKQEVLQLAAGE